MQSYSKHILALFLIGIMVLVIDYYLDQKTQTQNIESPYHMMTWPYGDGKWGYQIYRDSELIIQQAHIPAVGRKQYFSSREDAEKMGKIVLDKIKRNESPSISITELKVHKIAFEK